MIVDKGLEDLRNSLIVEVNDRFNNIDGLALNFEYIKIYLEVTM